MPDDALFAAAKDGSLLQPATLEAQLDRLLADGKATGLHPKLSPANGSTSVSSSPTGVTASGFHDLHGELSDAMAQEGYLWFQEFVNKDRPLSDWFTADFNFVNDTLAQHYGMPAPGSGAQMTRVEVTTDQRKGFLGLASFLTQTSFRAARRHAARRLGAVRAALLATAATAQQRTQARTERRRPAEMAQPAGTENVKTRLERHRSDPVCAACHKMLDRSTRPRALRRHRPLP